jgi:hypothetical protein
LLSLISREFFLGHHDSDRLSKVTLAVSLSYSLVAQTGYEPRLNLRLLFKSEKEGIISYCISIIIATAAMEGIYKRLCWIYITVKNTLVFFL